MKITFKVEYDKQEKLEGFANTEMSITIDAGCMHSSITKAYFGFITGIGFILPIEYHELIHE